MKVPFKKIKVCRICQSKDLKKILDLNDQPPANNLYKNFKNKPENIPLNLIICKKCKTLQIEENVEPTYLFSRYFWVTSTSKVANDFSKIFFDNVFNICKKNKAKINKNDLVIEIASNDGTFLNVFKNNNFKVLGIDPALNIAKIANDQKIETLPFFFNKKKSEVIKKKYGVPKIIYARNVIPHVLEIHSVIKGIKNLLNEDSFGFIEFHDAKLLKQKNHYDYIYHEHLFYFTINTISNLLAKYKLRVFDIFKSPISGGSWVVAFSIKNYTKSLVLKKEITKEKSFKLDKIVTWQKFAKNSIKHSKKILKIVNQYENVIAYGASARGSTLLNFAKLNNQNIKIILDKNKLKNRLYSPGSNILIKLPEKQLSNILRSKLILILAWNFKEEITTYLKQIGYTGKFIIPLPNNPKII